MPFARSAFDPRAETVGGQRFDREGVPCVALVHRIGVPAKAGYNFVRAALGVSRREIRAIVKRPTLRRLKMNHHRHGTCPA